MGLPLRISVGANSCILFFLLGLREISNPVANMYLVMKNALTAKIVHLHIDVITEKAAVIEFVKGTFKSDKSRQWRLLAL